MQIEVPSLLLDVFEHLHGQRREVFGRQTLQVLSLEITHAEHASHRAKTRDLTPLAQLLSTWARATRRFDAMFTSA